MRNLPEATLGLLPRTALLQGSPWLVTGGPGLLAVGGAGPMAKTLALLHDWSLKSWAPV